MNIFIIKQFIFLEMDHEMDHEVWLLICVKISTKYFCLFNQCFLLPTKLVSASTKL